jgi:phenylacetate-coenzyme A ligase PaaK-like adenylate-forming protein
MFDTLYFLSRIVVEKSAGRKTPNAIHEVQERRLRRLVAHAKTNSPFYAERFRSIDPARFELSELRPVTKTEMMTHFDDFLTDRSLKRAELEEFMSDPNRLGQWYRGRYAPSHTSGTQGVQAIIVQDRRMLELLFVLQMTRGTVFPTGPIGVLKRLVRPARLAVGTIGGGFFPTAVALAYVPKAALRFVNRLWLKHIEPIGEVTEQLNRFQPDVLLAYANILELLGREALAGRLHLGRENPLRQIINMSEPLSNGARKLIGDAFGLPVTNNYACGECMALSLGCPQGHGMHLQADWAILEVVDDQYRPVEPGQPGSRVLMTNLYNHIQPFIRYEMADAVTLSPTPCPCGSPFPLIQDVEGRSDEVVWIRDGDHYRQVHPYVFVDVLDDFPAVGWYQIIQQERNQFLLRAAPAPHHQLNAEDLRKVVDRGLRRFGLAELVEFQFDITDQLAPNPHTGKLKRITSRIGPPEEVGDESVHPVAGLKA